MGDIELEVLEIRCGFCIGDIILYLYSDSNLCDALTLKPNQPSSTITRISAIPYQIIQIMAKDLENSAHIGTVSFELSVLLDSPGPLPLFFDNSQGKKDFLLLTCNSSQKKDSDLQSFRINVRENDICKAMKSEIDLEKWKNNGIKQIREEMNVSELARVSVMKKICENVEKYEKEIKELKEKIRGGGFKSQILAEKTELIGKELEIHRESIKAREKAYLARIAGLQTEKTQRSLEILRIKEENSLTSSEFFDFSNKTPEKSRENFEQMEKIDLLQGFLQQKISESSSLTQNLQETFMQIEQFHIQNTELRSYIQSIESKIEKNLSSNQNITDLITSHLEMLSINADVIKITENIYKIDNESLHLFIQNNELMTQQGTQNITFIEWLQKNKWRAADEEPEFVNEKHKKLDTVPEEEEEEVEEEEPVIKTPVKKNGKVPRKSPPIKSKKDFSPILKKKF